MAIVAEGEGGRVYLSPTSDHEVAAKKAVPEWKPDCEMPKKHRNFQPPGYGMTNLGDLFTSRQLVALTTFSDLVSEAMTDIRQASLSSCWFCRCRKVIERRWKRSNGVCRCSRYVSWVRGWETRGQKVRTICTWDAGPASNRTPTGRSARVATVRVTFGRQALPMTWDYAEVNFFSD